MRNICTIEGCGKYVKGYGLCNSHYKRRLYIQGDIGPRTPCSISGCDKRRYGKELCRKHYDAKRRSENKEYTRAMHRRYLSIPENIAKGKAYRIATAEKKLAYDRAYRAANTEKVRWQSSVKTARRRGADGHFTLSEIRDLFRKQRGRCAICRFKLGADYHKDHIEPIYLGGTNWISNIQLLCPTCNLEKSCKHPIEFMQSKGLLL